MKIKDILSDNTEKVTHNKKRRRRRNKEKLSFKDIENLMGIHRDRYERRGGAVKRK